MERLTERFDGWVMRKGCHGPCRTCNWAECADIYPMIDRLAAYEDTGLEPGEIMGLCSMSERAKMADLLRLEDYQALGPIDHLRDLAQAEKDGRLVVLPCKIGDAYFTVERFCDENGELPEFTLHGVSDCEWCCVPCNKQLRIVEHRFSSIKHILNLEDSIGKFVLLTRAEAEAALERRKGEQNETD